MWAFAAIASASGDYCSLVVEVVAPNGKRPTADVTVIEQNGRKLEQLSEGQDAKFCDLGLLPVSVKVGDDVTCNQVIVSEVPLSWLKTYHLKVIYDLKPCLKDLPHLPTPFCTYLFRISDTAGKWISGASAQVMPGNLTLASDTSGRVSVDTNLGSVTATISAAGYSTRSFDSTCTVAKSAEPEEAFIRLSRK